MIAQGYGEWLFCCSHSVEGSFSIKHSVSRVHKICARYLGVPPPGGLGQVVKMLGSGQTFNIHETVLPLGKGLINDTH